jgi:hypothetical protein
VITERCVPRERPVLNNGALAQLGEHLLCKQGVVGSIPTSSTTPAVHDFWVCSSGG